MTGQPQDPSDRPPNFGPNRHRMEIELMEKRFRERSDRSGGGPVATEEIDIRIADEARQFFDDSARTLEAVVPQLQEGDQGREMLETTGEIRKKIDQFFTDTGETEGAGAGAAGGVSPQRRAAAPSAPPPAPPPPRPGSAPAGAQMDLKTALEKLRRHGAAKAAGHLPPPAKPSAPEPRRPLMDSSASLEARPFGAPRPAAPESAAPVGETLPAMDTTGSIAPARPREGVELLKQLSSLPPLDTEELGRPSESAPTLRGHRPPDTREIAASAERAAPVERAPAAELRPAEREPAPERPRAELPPIAAGGEFDSIFSAVEGIVLDTLKTSMNETMSSARKSEPELAEVAVPTAEPIAEAPEPRETFESRDAFETRETPETATQDLSQDLSDRIDDVEARDLTQDVPQDETQDETDVPVREMAAKLPAPREDEEDEDLDRGVPSDAPYDWGVKPVARPRGAWLLDTPEGGSDAPAAKAEPAPQQAPAGDSPSPGGPRAFLIRKASDEVRKFGPVLDALTKQNLVDPDVIDPSRADPTIEEDDDAVSLDTFRDDRPSPEEVDQELSPMRLVEELRKLRRLTQALVDKGVIAPSEVDKAESDSE